MNENLSELAFLTVTGGAVITYHEAAKPLNSVFL
jgi:hypothetical protein